MGSLNFRWYHAEKSAGLLLKVLVLVSLFLVSGSFALISGPLGRPVYAPSTLANLAEWTIPTAGSTPTGLALDPSGSCCWFVEYSGNKVAHLDPVANTFQEWAIPTANAEPTSLATATISGSTVIFGVEFATNKVFIFFTNTGTFKEYTLPTVDSGPEYISIEPGGAGEIRSWFTELGRPSNSYTRNSMGEIIYNTGTNVATLYEWTLPGGAGGGANGIFASSGDIFLAGVTGIVKWDRASSQFTAWPIPSHPSTTGLFLALDNSGQVWYTSRSPGGSSTNNYVGVLVGGGLSFKEWQIPTAGADPRVISISPVTQNPWVAEQGGSKVALLDPSAGFTTTGASPTVSSFSPVLGALVTSTAGPVPPTTTPVAPSTTTNTGSTTGQFTEWTLPGSTPHEVLADSSGNVWILETGTNKVAKLTMALPDFSLATTPGTISIPQGGSGGLTVTGTSILGYSGPVTLSITGSVPSGVTFSSFTPNPISIPAGGTAPATLTINVSPSASTGSSTIIVSGTGTVTRTTSFILTVTSGADFSLSLSSPSLSIGSGESATDAVTVTSSAPFNSAVTLTTGALPAGVHVGFSPNPVTPPSGGSVASIMTISVDSGTPASTQTIQITGTSDSLTHSQNLMLTITVTPDFSIGANPISVTLPQAGSGTSTITVGSTNGFSSPVALTYSWVGTAPSDVSVSLPGPVTPPSGSTATSTLTVSASVSSSTGSFTLSITGASGSLTHSVNVGVQINAISSTSTTTTTPPAPKCLIATATYGSELAPEVQLLRNFRDNSILKTSAGSNFMTAFNAWYYSFSPYVAGYLNTHRVERTIMKGVLYPLIGMLFVTSELFLATSAYPELAALLSGLLASSLIGAFYLGLPLSVLRAKIRRLRGWRGERLLEKSLAGVLFAGLIALAIGEGFASPIILMVSSASIVLSTLFLSATITSAKISKRLSK